LRFNKPLNLIYQLYQLNELDGGPDRGPRFYEPLDLINQLYQLNQLDGGPDRGPRRGLRR